MSIQKEIQQLNLEIQRLKKENMELKGRLAQKFEAIVKKLNKGELAEANLNNIKAQTKMYEQLADSVIEEKQYVEAMVDHGEQLKRVMTSNEKIRTSLTQVIARLNMLDQGWWKELAEEVKTYNQQYYERMTVNKTIESEVNSE